MTAPSFPAGSHEADVWRVVQQVNQAWLHGHIDTLRDLLHPAMVIAPPDGAEPVRGREACIDSYRDFTVQARVLRFEEFAPTADVFGNTAVVAYEFEIFYELAGTWTTERGREVVALSLSDARWWVVWRTQLSTADHAS
jgi:hypothetical protein